MKVNHHDIAVMACREAKRPDSDWRHDHAAHTLVDTAARRGMRSVVEACTRIPSSPAPDSEPGAGIDPHGGARYLGPVIPLDLTGTMVAGARRAAPAPDAPTVARAVAPGLDGPAGVLGRSTPAPTDPRNAPTPGTGARKA
jgi:hypothetical protein